MVVALLVTAAGMVGLLPAHGLPQQAAAAASSASATCPGEVGQCVTVAAPCSSGPCLTVTAGPTEDIGAGQYVFLALSNFPAGDTARVAYCPTTDPVTIVADPQCGRGPFLGTVLSPSVLPVQANGTLLASFPTEVDASGQGNAPISANQIVTSVPPVPPATFFCDNGPDYCAIEVTDDGPGVGLGAGNPDDTAANTLIIPITFASSSGGCPASDPLLFTDSAFSLEHFIPPAVDSTCGGATGVADANTATNSEEVVSDFASGGSQIVFTDDPDDPAQVADLEGEQYAFIPVAVSATVVAFLAGDSQPAQRVAYPVSSYNLTPNMVAGLITSNYTAPNGSDVLIPPLSCAQIAGCSAANTSDYDAFDLLNPAPAGLTTPGAFGLSFSSVASGASYQVSDWACHAPNVAFTVSVPLKGGSGTESRLGGSARTTTTTTIPAPSSVSVTDDNVAATTMTSAPTAGVAWPPLGDPTAAWPYPKCQAYPILPVLSASSAQYTFAQTPSAQALDIRKYAYQGGGQPGLQGPVSLAAFGAMDWSEAAYAGLPSASLQNAAGNFVAPSTSSIDDALADATTGANGVLSYNYDDTDDANAYPMPLVTYAIVSTASQSAFADEAEGDLLANLVSYSHSGGSIPLPPGYVALPDNLYDQADADITKLFPTAVIPAATSPSASSPAATRSPGVGASASSETPGGSEDGGGATGATTPPSGGTKSTTSRSTALRATPPPPGFDPVILAVLSGRDGWILPGLIAVMLLLFVAGPAIYGAPRLRRRMSRAKETKT
jgi:hypothetical protein